MDDRIVELELRYTEQQDQLEQLSRVVYEQGRVVDALKAELVRLARLLESQEGEDGPMPHDKPPHY